jgi:hypothetical protein
MAPLRLTAGHAESGWSMFRSDRFASIVTRGLDPRVHLFRKKMDRRVKPGNDSELDQFDWNRL